MRRSSLFVAALIAAGLWPLAAHAQAPAEPQNRVDVIKVEGAIDRITRTALGAGLLVGTVASTGERARALVAKGHRIVLHSVGALLKTGAEAFFAAATGQA